MNLRALINQARAKLRDEDQDYLWSDNTLTTFINNAIEEACLRSRCLKRTIQAVVPPYSTHITLPYEILHLKFPMAGAVNGDEMPATQCEAGKYYVIATPGTTVFTSFGAMANTVDTLFAARGVPTGTGTVYPAVAMPVKFISQAEASSINTSYFLTGSQTMWLSIGDTDDVLVVQPSTNKKVILQMMVARVPLDTEQLVTTTPTGVPAIPISFHRDLLDWVLYEAYCVDE